MPAQALEAIKDVVGPRGWLSDRDEMRPYLVEQRGRFCGRTPLVVRPDTALQVAEVVRICDQAAIAIVPQGGNTGLTVGSVPDERGDELVLSLSRMNRIRELDRVNLTATVEAGCILATLQQAAAASDLLFPLSLGSEGTCQLGGNLATNAGGTGVLRYGNARELVLGLEVVLANGEMWNGLRRLRKDNTGYDLKQLFLGSEGTLGIITAAVVRLYPRPRHQHTALAAVSGTKAALELLAAFQDHCGECLSAFEYLDRNSMRVVLEQLPNRRNPLGEQYDHYVLIELTTVRTIDDLGSSCEAVLAKGFECGEVIDAVIAASRTQAEDLWQLREGVSEAQTRLGMPIKHDVSVPVSQVPEFLAQAADAVTAEVPGVRVVAFGHLGDGNIHFNLSHPNGMDEDDFQACAASLNRKVHDIAVALEGSFSAEHGIGRLKRDELVHYRSPVELRLMRSLKKTLDPRNILNPGVVL